eukprot:CAMPEP_0183415994 /NCGR_PEP_ID=MMETSP0370-20130417/23473_1 /TAXON_ID=268820 /ORGANISM="Peridinium aciculiferum, Strain PAER-2" /LENGTH=149 /DNA_ID=CAMNT_0025599473 /DNA_START=168 /DNA_END=615 /DNA_ORIENTATION=-
MQKGIREPTTASCPEPNRRTPPSRPAISPHQNAHWSRLQADRHPCQAVGELHDCDRSVLALWHFHRQLCHSMNSKKCAMSLSNVSLGIDTQPVLHVSKPLPSSSTSLMRDFPHREDVEDLELLILWNALKLRGALVHARDLGCRNIIAQ